MHFACCFVRQASQAESDNLAGEAPNSRRGIAHVAWAQAVVIFHWAIPGLLPAAAARRNSAVAMVVLTCLVKGARASRVVQQVLQPGSLRMFFVSAYVFFNLFVFKL